MEKILGHDQLTPAEIAEDLISEARVTSWPVQVDLLADHHGIRIHYEPLDDELSGMCFYKEDVPFIGVNSMHSKNRQRFTIAHEFGHVMLHNHVLQQQPHVDKTIALRRDSASAQGDIELEVQANQFAASLLMPEFLIKKYMEEHDLDYDTIPDADAIKEMAKAFKVSEMAMTYRVGTRY
jgi:Zn-dependent peptidase ImmA (M78 family)